MSPAEPSPDDLLDGLDEEQRHAVETLRGPVCILAGAGTGKTRALTHRIAYGVATGAFHPSQVMALTFTNRAAGELRTRLRGLGAAGVPARTFHAAALAQLSHFWPRVAGGPAPQILGAKGRLLGQLADELRLRIDTAVLRDVAAEIEWRKVSGKSIAQYATAGRPLPPGLDLDRMIALHEGYERIKDERRRIDFEDVLLATAGMLAEEPWVADEVRSQYRVFVVDEFQDVSPAQHTLLELWLGTRRELCVVGDASQTIYGFAGATGHYLLDFPRRYPEAEVIRLERNYRSLPPVLDLANRLMRRQPGALELISARSDTGSRPPVPDIHAHDSDASEADAVADAVAAEIAGGRRPEQIAVLYRVNSQAQFFASALATRGVGSRELGGARFFDLDVVRRAMLELGSLAREQSGTGPAPPLFQSVSDVARSSGWSSTPPAVGGGAVRERWEALTALVELADAAAPGTRLADFVAELHARQAAQHEPPVAAVVLSTLHGAKGLEWDSVHLVGLAEGLLPISHARDQAQLDEERRLLYVGITRARERLQLHWAREGLRGRSREPSRFLTELRSDSRGGSRRAAR